MKHSDLFDFFLNKQVIKLPEKMDRSPKAINQFSLLVEEGKWTEIVKVPYYPFYAMELSRQGAITPFQCETILSVNQAAGVPIFRDNATLIKKKKKRKSKHTDDNSHHGKIIQTTSIFVKYNDGSLQFSKSFIKLLKDAKFVGRGSISDPVFMEQLRLLILALDKSEQMYYIINYDDQEFRKDEEELFYSPLGDNDGTHGAVKAYVVRHAWDHRNSCHKTQLIFFSSSITLALRMAQVGPFNACINLSALGDFTIDDIEDCVEQNIRPTTITYDGQRRADQDIHGIKNTSPVLVTFHDEYHGERHHTMTERYPGRSGGLHFTLNLIKNRIQKAMDPDMYSYLLMPCDKQTWDHLNGRTILQQNCVTDKTGLKQQGKGYPLLVWAYDQDNPSRAKLFAIRRRRGRFSCELEQDLRAEDQKQFAQLVNPEQNMSTNSSTLQLIASGHSLT
ncbi:MAG: hypothetical protein GY821_00210 [Gammaproteobacteria bacterium]|nr:hypothetical protein [Gammaproteobacteria bacterium]